MAQEELRLTVKKIDKGVVKRNLTQKYRKQKKVATHKKA